MVGFGQEGLNRGACLASRCQGLGKSPERAHGQISEVISCDILPIFCASESQVSASAGHLKVTRSRFC